MVLSHGFGARLALYAFCLGVFSGVAFVVDASSASEGLSESELLSQLPPQTTMVDLLKRVRELTRERDACRSSLRNLKDGKQRQQGATSESADSASDKADSPSGKKSSWFGFFRRPQRSPSDAREEPVNYKTYARNLYSRVIASCGRVTTSLATFFSVSTIFVGRTLLVITLLIAFNILAWCWLRFAQLCCMIRVLWNAAFAIPLVIVMKNVFLSVWGIISETLQKPKMASFLDAVRLLDDLKKLKFARNESASAFVARVISVIKSRKVNLPDEVVVPVVLDHLDDNLRRMMLQVDKHLTLEKISAMLESAEYLRSAKDLSAYGARIDAPQTIKAERECVAEPRISVKTCHRCGGSAHPMWTCPLRPTHPSKPCVICGNGHYHWRDQCPQRVGSTDRMMAQRVGRQPRTNHEVLPTEKTRDAARYLYHVEASIPSHPQGVSMLVDSGSAHSHLPQSVVKKLGLPVDASDIKIVAGFNGSIEPILGVAKMAVTLGDEQRTVSFLVSKAVSKIILGNEAMKDFALKLNWKEDCLEAENGTRLYCHHVASKNE